MLFASSVENDSACKFMILSGKLMGKKKIQKRTTSLNQSLSNKVTQMASNSIRSSLLSLLPVDMIFFCAVTSAVIDKSPPALCQRVLSRYQVGEYKNRRCSTKLLPIIWSAVNDNSAATRAWNKEMKMNLTLSRHFIPFNWQALIRC